MTATAEQVRTLQQALNPILFLTGFETIAEDGVFDARLCGAIRAANERLAQVGGSLPAEARPHIARWFEVMGVAGAGVQQTCSVAPEPWPTPRLTSSGQEQVAREAERATAPELDWRGRVGILLMVATAGLLIWDWRRR